MSQHFKSALEKFNANELDEYIGVFVKLHKEYVSIGHLFVFNIYYAYRKKRGLAVSASDYDLFKERFDIDNYMSDISFVKSEHDDTDVILSKNNPIIVGNKLTLSNNSLAHYFPLFDEEYYLKQYVGPDIDTSLYDHYLNHGLAIGLSPNKTVSKTRYLALKNKPLFSILMPTFNTNVCHLNESIFSVVNQSYDNWELLIVDDASTNSETIDSLKYYASLDSRIKVIFNDSNLGISSSSNKLLSMAKGDFIALLDHDDAIVPQALYEIALVINDELFTDVVYTDHAYVDEFGKYSFTHQKPKWSKWFFYGVMYIGHLLVVKRDLAIKSGGFDSRFDFVQDYEFMLRVSVLAKKISHCPKVLYKWRQASTSVAGGGKSEIDFNKLQNTAVNNHLSKNYKNLFAKSNREYYHRQIIDVICPNFCDELGLILYGNSSDIKIYNKKNCDSGLIDFSIDYIDISDASWFSEFLSILSKNSKKYLAFWNVSCVNFTVDIINEVSKFLAVESIGASSPIILNDQGSVKSYGYVQHNLHLKPFPFSCANTSADNFGMNSCIRDVDYLDPNCIFLNSRVFDDHDFIREEFGIGYILIEAQQKLRDSGHSCVLNPNAIVLLKNTENCILALNRLGEHYWSNYCYSQSDV